MARAGELDWSDLYKGIRGEPEDSLSRPVETNSHLGGEHVTKEELMKDAHRILEGAKQYQVTDEDFARMAAPNLEQLPTQEELDEEWENSYKNLSKALSAPIQKTKDDPNDWGRGPIEKEEYTEEMARISRIAVSAGALE